MTCRLGLAVVQGRSMAPTLRDGDLLLVGWGMPVCPGRLALVRLPGSPGASRVLAVKRVSGRDPGDPARWWVERDNPAEGVDSWLVGGVPDADVPALVLARLPRWLAAARRRLATGRCSRPSRLGC